MVALIAPDFGIGIVLVALESAGKRKTQILYNVQYNI